MGSHASAVVPRSLPSERGFRSERCGPNRTHRTENMTMTTIPDTACSCVEHADYRQLDRNCPTHGDTAETRRRREPTSLERLELATARAREMNRLLRLDRGENPDPTFEEEQAAMLRLQARNDQRAAEWRAKRDGQSS